MRPNREERERRVRSLLGAVGSSLEEASRAWAALQDILDSVDASPAYPRANAEKVVLDTLRDRAGDLVPVQDLNAALKERGMTAKPSGVIYRLRKRGWPIETAPAGGKAYRLLKESGREPTTDDIERPHATARLLRSDSSRAAGRDGYQ